MLEAHAHRTCCGRRWGIRGRHGGHDRRPGPRPGSRPGPRLGPGSHPGPGRPGPAAAAASLSLSPAMHTTGSANANDEYSVLAAMHAGSCPAGSTDQSAVDCSMALLEEMSAEYANCNYAESMPNAQDGLPCYMTCSAATCPSDAPTCLMALYSSQLQQRVTHCYPHLLAADEDLALNGRLHSRSLLELNKGEAVLAPLIFQVDPLGAPLDHAKAREGFLQLFCGHIWREVVHEDACTWHIVLEKPAQGITIFQLNVPGTRCDQVRAACWRTLRLLSCALLAPQMSACLRCTSCTGLQVSSTFSELPKHDSSGTLPTSLHQNAETCKARGDALAVATSTLCLVSSGLSINRSVGISSLDADPLVLQTHPVGLMPLAGSALCVLAGDWGREREEGAGGVAGGAGVALGAEGVFWTGFGGGAAALAPRLRRSAYERGAAGSDGVACTSHTLSAL